MGKINRFEDLQIWVASQAIAANIYKKTLNMKDYYLRDQINRAALSISNNIAEGFEYNNSAEFIRFLKYAKGSCGEYRNMLYFIKNIGLIGADEFNELLKEAEVVSSQIMTLMKYLRKRVKEEKR